MSVSDRPQLFPLANIPPCIRRRPLTERGAACQSVEIVSVSVDGGAWLVRTGRTRRRRSGDELVAAAAAIRRSTVIIRGVQTAA